MKENSQELLKKLPSVDNLLKDAQLVSFFNNVPRKIIVNAVRQAVEQARELIIKERTADYEQKDIYQKIISEAKSQIDSFRRSYYRRVINATGIILHTGLGRAVLAKEAIEQIQNELSGYSLLQLDTESGKRSKRDDRVEWLLQQLTGAEAATVVNNNAAATAIVLNTIAKGKEVIVSRGQLVEIGGSFRLPAVMEFSGAKLVEVGTTNRTHPADYENAITENTAAILRVHPSNYKIQGFVSEVALNELVKIAHSHNLVMIDDVGSGALFDFTKFGFAPEPTLPESIAAGADIVTSSADKLIGASQAGLILGKKNLIGAIRKNPFARIVRVGKLTLAALEATLKLFFDEDQAIQKVPTLQMMLADISEIAKKAETIATRLSKLKVNAKVEIIDGFSETGSGSLPTQQLATKLVSIEPKNMNAETLAEKLRQNNPPIIARISEDKVMMDPRTLADGDDSIIAEALKRIVS
jgi:L-seryl-tRNA(Ser) seleniumtransferase